MTYPRQHPEFPLGDALARKQRPIVDHAELVVRAQEVGYMQSISTA